MPLQRGPFVLQPDSHVQVAPGVYDFQETVLEDWQQIDITLAEMDTIEATLELAAAAPADPFPDVDIDSALNVAVQGTTYDLVPEYDDMVQAVADATAQYTTALNDAPPQAFNPVTAPFNPNIPGLLLAPVVVPPGGFQPGSITPVGTSSGAGTGSSTTTTRSLSLINSTAYGAANFVVGDQFIVTAHGLPGEDVKVAGTFNGEAFNPVVVGQIDSTGQFVLQGTMPPVNVGVWKEDWYVGDQFIATYAFVVAANSST